MDDRTTRTGYDTRTTRSDLDRTTRSGMGTGLIGLLLALLVILGIAYFAGFFGNRTTTATNPNPPVTTSQAPTTPAPAPAPGPAPARPAPAPAQ